MESSSTSGFYLITALDKICWAPDALSGEILVVRAHLFIWSKTMSVRSREGSGRTLGSSYLSPLALVIHLCVDFDICWSPHNAFQILGIELPHR